MSEHIPEPWEYNAGPMLGTQRRTVWGGPEGRIVANIYGATDAQGEANARLVAAAPRNARERELLLGFIRDDLCDLADALGTDHPCERRRLALIAQLEGEGR